MDDLCSSMFELALSSLMLVGGQHYLSKKPEIPATTSTKHPLIAANIPPSFAR